MLLISKDDTLKYPSLLDPWSILHFLIGIIFALFFYIIHLSFLNGFIIFNIIHLLYEIKDYCGSYTNLLDDYNKRIPSKLQTFIKDNSYQNSISDQIVAIMGYLLGYYLLQNNYLTEKNIIYFSIILITVFLIVYF